MKTFVLILIVAVVILFSPVLQAEKPSKDGLHEMHMIMQFMDHGL